MFIEIPEELTAKATNVTWLNIQGPLPVMRQLDAWMAQEKIFPLFACGGAFGPTFINGPFSPANAQQIMDKVVDLKLKMPPK